VTHDEVPVQMLRKLLYVGKLLAAIEAQEHIDTQSSRKEGKYELQKAEGFDTHRKPDNRHNSQKTQT
jgi:hypothetical protein